MRENVFVMYRHPIDMHRSAFKLARDIERLEMV